MNFVKPIKISCVLPSISQPLKNKFIQACYFGGFHVIIHNYLVIQKIGRYPSTIWCFHVLIFVLNVTISIAHNIWEYATLANSNPRQL